MFGILTTFINDMALASIFGCLVGLKDTVMTAITLVALGTSLPNLFASRQATVQEKYADNSIGNMMGHHFYLLECEVNIKKYIYLYTLLSAYHKLKFDSLFMTHFFTVCDWRSSWGGDEAK